MAVKTATMCLNKEVVQQVSDTQIAFECYCQVKSCDAMYKEMLRSMHLILIEVEL